MDESVGPRPVNKPASVRHGRIDDIEVLRAIAILFVILSHAGLYYPKPNWLAVQTVLGHVRFRDGVDLFFAVSGFVIGRSLLPLLEQARGAAEILPVLRLFFIKRMFRLWPAGWLWLAVILIASLVIDLPATLGTPRENLWGTASAVLLFANLRFASDAAAGQYFGGDFPYWSLSLEEQFYIILPLVMLAAGRFLPFLLMLGIIVQWPLAHGAWLQALRSAALCWGVLLAIFERTALHAACEPVLLRRHPLLPGLAAAALLVMLGRGSAPPGTSPRLEFGDIALIAAALVWLASYDRGYVGSWPGLRRVLVWVGGRSYSIYLAHVPCGIATAAITGWMVRRFTLADTAEILLTVAIGAILLSAMAELSYRWVEAPFRRIGRHMASG